MAAANVATKAMYSLFDLKCSKLEIRMKQFLRKLIKVVLKEINTLNALIMTGCFLVQKFNDRY